MSDRRPSPPLALADDVAPQYCSALGKIANCQTLVSLTLADRVQRLLAQTRHSAALGGWRQLPDHPILVVVVGVLWLRRTFRHGFSSDAILIDLEIDEFIAVADQQLGAGVEGVVGDLRPVRLRQQDRTGQEFLLDGMAHRIRILVTDEALQAADIGADQARVVAGRGGGHAQSSFGSVTRIRQARWFVQGIGAQIFRPDEGGGEGIWSIFALQP